MRPFFILFISIFAFGFLLGFQNEAVVESFDQKRDRLVKKRVDEFKLRSYEKCRKKLMQRANEIADSTILADAKKFKGDNPDKPDRPTKPSTPEIKEANDSIPVEPLFK